MKKTCVKLLSFAFAMITVITAIFIARVEIHGSGSNTVYYNDRPWYSETRLPAENVYGAIYLPLDLFVQLPSVNVRVNETLNTFIITHGDKYLSFDVSSNFAANQDRVRMYIATAEYHGERYIPAKTVCTLLGLRYEEMVSSATGAVAVRVSDEGSKKSFSELIKKHNPEFLEQKETTVTEETTEAPVLSERTVYITVDLTEGDFADRILALLEKYECRATFFISGKILEDSPKLLSKIAAHGHELAIYADGKAWDGFDTAEEIIDYIEEKNGFLARTIRRKSHIIALPHGGNVIMKDEAKEALSNAGYFAWYGNVNISPEMSAYRGAMRAIEGIWDNEIVGLRFTESPYISDTLERVLKFIDSNSGVCELRTVTPPFKGYGNSK